MKSNIIYLPNKRLSAKLSAICFPSKTHFESRVKKDEMSHKSDLCIVLKSVRYNERDRIVTAVSLKSGKVTAIAKNAVHSRRFGGTLDPFVASEWKYFEKPGREMFRLDEAQIRKPFDKLRGNFDHLCLASIFSETLIRVAQPGEPCPDLFKLHSNALACIEELDDNEDPKRLISLLNAYYSKILKWCGNQARIDSCLACEGSLKPYLAQSEHLLGNIPEAGWICVSCRKDRDMMSALQEEQLVSMSPLALIDFCITLDEPIRSCQELLQGALADQRALFAFLLGMVRYHLPSFDKQELKSLELFTPIAATKNDTGNPAPSSERFQKQHSVHL